jgi:hypothetical protein
MSAFDNVCSKTTADSSWNYSSTVFVDVDMNENCKDNVNDIKINSSIGSNDTILSNFKKADTLADNFGSFHFFDSAAS